MLVISSLSIALFSKDHHHLYIRRFLRFCEGWSIIGTWSITGVVFLVFIWSLTEINIIIVDLYNFAIRQVTDLS